MKSHSTQTPAAKTEHLPRLLSLCCAACLLFVTPAISHAQATRGQWDEIVGKTIRNNEGVRLGTVRDFVLDLEHGRLVGILVSSGGFLGIGAKSILVPPGALREDGTYRTLILNMDKTTFRNTPVFSLSGDSGRPRSDETLAVYRHYGQQPSFAIDRGTGNLAGQKLTPLGYLRKGSRIMYMKVENLQGVPLGHVVGFRELSRTSGLFKGVVIRPIGNYSGDGLKIVQPQDLRYNLKNNTLRLNDHSQEFQDSPDFTISRRGRFQEDSPERPGTPLPPLVHGESARDREITRRIKARVFADKDLSSSGENIDIGTINGKTILRGRVVNVAARNRLVGYATEISGEGNVVDQLIVKPITAGEQRIDL